jgi:HPt (histidine-containing phosphotransfer) domain-containing protein
MNPPPVASFPLPQAALPAVDGERLRELLDPPRLEESLALLRDLFETFRTEATPQIKTLALAWPAGDALAARQAAHFLAGSAANLGLVRLADWLRELEVLARAGQFPAGPDLTALFDATTRETGVAFALILAELQPSS